MTINVRVPYTEYKNRYEGFEKAKRNYNAEDKTIEIEIGEKRYNKLQSEDKKYAGLALQAIIALLQPGEAEKFVLIGSDKIEKAYTENKDKMSDNQRKCTERAIELMKEYGI